MQSVALRQCVSIIGTWPMLSNGMSSVAGKLATVLDEATEVRREIRLKLICEPSYFRT